jgi:hypothetical protein
VTTLIPNDITIAAFCDSCLTHPDPVVHAILQTAQCNDWLDCAWYDDMVSACFIDATSYATESGSNATRETIEKLARHMAVHCVVYRANVDSHVW